MAVNDGTVSEAESFTDAFGAPEAETPSKGGENRDELGRFAPKEEPEAEPEVTQEPEKQDHRIPLRELLDERERRQNLERERDDYRRRVSEFERQQAEAALAEKRKNLRPDSLVDPDGYDAFQETRLDERVRSVEEMVQNRIFDMTLAEQDEANPEEFGKAFSALQQAMREADPIVSRIKGAPNPGKALMRWHRQQEANREIGGDIAGFKKKFRAELMNDPEFGKEFMEAMEARARGGSGISRSSNVSELPSLNRATGSGSRSDSGGGSDREEFNSAFGRPPRKR